MATDKELKRRRDKPREASPSARHAGSSHGNMSAREASLVGGAVSREQHGRPSDQRSEAPRPPSRDRDREQ